MGAFEEGDLVHYKKGLWRVVEFQPGSLYLTDLGRLKVNETKVVIEHFAGPKVKRFFGLLGTKSKMTVDWDKIEALSAMETLAWAWGQRNEQA